MLQQRRQQLDVTGLAAVLRAMSPGLQRPLWDNLPSIPGRLLAVTGSQDPRFCMLGQDMLAARSAGPDMGVHDDLQVLEGCGHAILTEAPLQLLTVLRRFLQGAR